LKFTDRTGLSSCGKVEVILPTLVCNGRRHDTGVETLFHTIREYFEARRDLTYEEEGPNGSKVATPIVHPSRVADSVGIVSARVAF
jgi:hypothetical protein